MSHFPRFLHQSAEIVAKRLLGCYMSRILDGEIVRVKIVETEAYDQTDPASHSFRGKTRRNEVMFGDCGHLYVYFTYGMHYCCNIVTGPKDHASAVLIRAVEPLGDIGILRKYRDIAGTGITNGPAKLCQALSIDASLNGHDLRLAPLTLHESPALNDTEIVQTTRIGLSTGRETKWRFYIRDNPYVSRQ